MRRKKELIDPRGGAPSQQQAQPLAGEMSEEEMFFDEESIGISMRSLKRSSRFLVFSVIFLVLCIGVLFLFITMYNSSIMNSERSCWVEQQTVEALAEIYVTENGFSSLPAYIEDIPGFESVERECPTGGSYTWNPITGQYSCSEHGHWPEGFNQAQSINQGTTTTVMEEAD